jgi:quercetin dioxygenase-like cupin family protein
VSVVTAVESDILQVVGDRLRVIVEGADSGNMFELFQVEGDIGSGPPPHAHPWVEAYFILKGSLILEIGAERTIGEAGTSAVVPAGEVHRFEVASPSATFIVATSGGKASAFFRDLSTNAPGAPTPENLPGIVEVAKRNGLTSPLF